MKPTEEYILKQPEFYQSILLHIISVVERVVPKATLEYKYGIPYFYLNKKPFCYLAPNHKKQFVDLGFAKGFQLKKNQEYLVSENRNTVKSLRYFDLKSIDNKILEEVLLEASIFYQ